MKNKSQIAIKWPSINHMNRIQKLIFKLCHRLVILKFIMKYQL